MFSRVSAQDIARCALRRVCRGGSLYNTRGYCIVVLPLSRSKGVYVAFHVVVGITSLVVYYLAVARGAGERQVARFRPRPCIHGNWRHNAPCLLRTTSVQMTRFVTLNYGHSRFATAQPSSIAAGTGSGHCSAGLGHGSRLLGRPLKFQPSV